MSAPVALTTFISSERFASEGSGILPGKNPSGWLFKVKTSQPAFLSTVGDIKEPAPFAQSTTTLRPPLISTLSSKSSIYWDIMLLLSLISPICSHETLEKVFSWTIFSIVLS